MKKQKFFKTLLSVLAVLFFISCSTDVAGGSSEETNTIAGILKFPNGTAAAHAAIQMQSITGNNSTIFSDTTDRTGNFSMTVKERGLYGISAIADSFAFYDTVSLNGHSIRREASLSKTFDISGHVYLREQIPAGQTVVQIPGSPWLTRTDSNGYFILTDVPQSSLSIAVNSPDKSFVLNQEYAIPADTANTQPQSSYSWILPLSTEYQIAGYWTFDYLASDNSISDIRSISGKALLYGNAEISQGRNSGNALKLNDAGDFAVIENDNGVLDSAQAFSIETWVNIDDFKAENAAIKNIVGKLGFQGNAVFSVALVQDTCNISGSAFAFFMASGNGDSLLCKNAAISSMPVQNNIWYYLAASWNGDSTNLFINGKQVASAPTPFATLSAPSSIPIYFGKENLSLRIDDVRLSTAALESIDVSHRYKE